MRTTLLFIHITAVAAWLGANFTQLMLLPMFERSGHAAAAIWHHATGRMSKVYYSVAGIVILVTGFGLVDRSGYSMGDAFVSIGIGVIFVGIVLGITLFGPRSRAAQMAHEASDAAAAARARRAIVIGGLIDTALVLFAVWAMVKKVGV